MRKALLLLLAAALVSGCGIIYRQPVFQGTLLEKTNVDQLQTGMTRQQVFSLLGSPAVADPFHQSRWDYVQTARRRVGDTEVKTLTLYFEGDALARWEGEYFPEADQELAQEMRRFGNLARDKDKPRQPRPTGN
jgi:outer membrane protein assembly factor BamE